jgi:hypothetical protein
MNQEEKDPSLKSPQEANTTRHINFREIEESDSTSGTNSTSDTEDASPTKKAWQELREDMKNKQADTNE